MSYSFKKEIKDVKEGRGLVRGGLGRGLEGVVVVLDCGVRGYIVGHQIAPGICEKKGVGFLFSYTVI